MVRIKNAEGGLIGYGGFYAFNMAVRYHSSSQLDTRFAPLMATVSLERFRGNLVSSPTPTRWQSIPTTSACW
ncbi:hypothetical protein PRJ_4172 [Pseudomonas sp. XWY-1]|nr:hypothetical protein PRJ_4172 [Pseudomonas sp. XWY-1]